jgi:hypothetical protein
MGVRFPGSGTSTSVDTEVFSASVIMFLLVMTVVGGYLTSRRHPKAIS